MNKSDYNEILQIYKDQIETLKSQLAESRKELSETKIHLFRLQEGLLQITAPQAYNDLIADRQPKAEMDPILAEKSKKVNEIREGWLKNLEGPLFKSADDMTIMLGGVISSGGITAKESLHGNDES